MPTIPQLLRTVAAIAVPEDDLEAQQGVPFETAEVPVGAKRIAYRAIAYDGSNDPVAATMDLQVLSVKPKPSNANYNAEAAVEGAAHDIGVPSGRLCVFDVNYAKTFTVRIVGGDMTGVDHIDIEWRVAG